MAEPGPAASVTEAAATSSERSPASSSEPPSAAPSAADAARARREARKAKILARGTDRLARITSAGRGSEGASLYPTTASASASASPRPDQSSSPAPAAPSAGEDKDKDKRKDAPKASTSSDVGAHLGAPRVGPDAQSDDPLQQFMRALQAQMGPGMGDEAGSRSGAGSGTSSPFPPFPGAGSGLGAGAGAGAGAEGQDPFAAMMAQMQAMRGDPGAAAAPPAASTWLDHLLAWAHLLAILVFALFTFGAAFTAHWSPAPVPTAQTFDHPPHSILKAWGRLARAPPDAADLGAFNLGAHMPLQQYPLFALFVTLEIVLQSARMWALRGKGGSSGGFVRTIASQIPIPAVRLFVQTGAQYWSLLSSLLDDIAVLIFVLGIAILAASWRAEL